VTVGHRDRLAASSMLGVATGQDGVLIWGTGHLPGISALLAEQGFRHVKTEWLRVGRLPGTITSLRVIMQSR
jgi:hypothetical protein